MSTRTDYIKFKINKDVITPEELEAQGYTISEDRSTASMNVTSETATYTFKKLPQTLDEIKQIPLDSKFGPLAANICAIATWQKSNYKSVTQIKPPSTASPNEENVEGLPVVLQAFEYLNGTGCHIANNERMDAINTMNSNFGYTTPKQQGGPFMFFRGAKPSNYYTPAEPYKITMYEGPYYIPAKKSTLSHPNGEPEKRMIFVEYEEESDDELQRYVDTYYSSKTGCYYLWENQFKHLIAGMKEAGDSEW